ncbi:hypothetical protein LC040_12150 [Bacillus tianshenii]|nr:hypothetical protein LC040_12150 [Bacillus tianshenii]
MKTRPSRKSQRRFKKQLIHTAAVFREEEYRDGYEWKEEFVHKKDIQCRISTSTPKNDEVKQYEQQQFTPVFTLYCLPEDIEPNDRIVHNGKLYEVKSEPRDPSHVGHHYEVPLERLNLNFEIRKVVLVIKESG